MFAVQTRVRFSGPTLALLASVLLQGVAVLQHQPADVRRRQCAPIILRAVNRLIFTLPRHHDLLYGQGGPVRGQGLKAVHVHVHRCGDGHNGT